MLRVLPRSRETLHATTNAIGGNPLTPLAIAVAFGRLQTVRTLLDLGAGVDEASNRGRTALGVAVVSHHLDVVRLLIERGANVNHADAAGRTPLMYAAAIDRADAEVADILLRAGARLEARDEEGLTALEYARRYGNTSVMPSLERAAVAAARRLTMTVTEEKP